MNVTFEIETTVYRHGVSYQATLTGSASVLTENYGADADGNRGEIQRYVTDIEVDDVALRNDDDALEGVVSFESLDKQIQLISLIESRTLSNN